MFSGIQLIGLYIFSMVALYVIIDRICTCIERTKNPIKNFETFMKCIKSVNDKNGN